MNADRVVFEQTIEALFVRALGARLTPTARQKLSAVGIDLSKKLLPAYPFDVWMRGLKIASDDVFPHQPEEQRLFLLGQVLLDGYNETMVGRALLGLIRVLGPKRTLMRARHNFRSGNNYTETTFKELGPGSYELWMNEVGPYPSFTAGILHAAVKAAGVEPTVELHGHDGHACTYRISWKA